MNASDPRDGPPGAPDARLALNATRPAMPIPDTEAPRDRGLLMEMGGVHAGRVHALEAEVTTLGRDDECTLAFADATLSRVHARIVRVAGSWLFEDLNSTNGSFVDNRPIRKQVLKHGDRLRVGASLAMQFLQVSAQEVEFMTRLYEAGVRDGLTGVHNRRALQERLDAEYAYASRHGTDLCVLMLDIDHFKRVNDTHGHPAGDAVLRAVASRLEVQVRREDFLARYGGEEFAVLVREVPLVLAAGIAERLRRSVETLDIPAGDAVLKVTVSAGVASVRSAAAAGRGAAGLVAAADQALYRAKEGGRNRVELSM